MIDQDSETWRDVLNFLKSSHDHAIAELKSPALDHANTQLTRGKLLTLEALQALPAAQRAASDLSTTPEDYYGRQN